MRGSVHPQRVIRRAWWRLQASRCHGFVTTSADIYQERAVSYSAAPAASFSKHLVPRTRTQLLQPFDLQQSRAIQSDTGAGGCAVEKVECVVIGAGVVGLAVARKLALTGREVVVVESDDTIGTGTSSRNSEVIHAGIYYPHGSLKARLCVEGRRALYRYCLDHGVPHRACGKLVVAASDSQLPALRRLWERGNENGVEDLRMVSAEEAHAMEPQLQCKQALLSPVTGILDSHSLMLSLQGNAEDGGATFAFNSTVVSGAVTTSAILLNVSDTNKLRSALSSSQPPHLHQTSTLGAQSCDRPTQQIIFHHKVPISIALEASVVVNCAGLDALPIARRIAGLPPHLVPRRHLARGCYFAVSGLSTPSFSRLIYPLPEDGGLGVHVTLDLGGQLKFGPDVEWLGSDTSDALFTDYDYRVDPSRSATFYPQVRKYFPSLPDNCIRPDYAGIRPKITGPGEAASDFLIQGEAEHGVKGLVNLFGIESPGLTACLAIADNVCSRLN